MDLAALTPCNQKDDNRPVSAELLTIEHLRVDFADVVAVNDVSLTLNAGSICGLIGPNGAGKTTIMRVVAGLQEATMGEVKLGPEQRWSQPQDRKRHVGFMPDFCPVYDRLTALEFLDHFARAYDIPAPQKRIDHCLELTGLADKRQALCEGLSRGMRQRLVLAKTLLPDPEILLLDEPASGLDPQARVELRELLVQMQTEGKAVLISSHILSELSAFCTQAAIMERGRLVASGTIAELGRQARLRRICVKWRGEDERPMRILAESGAKNMERAGSGACFDLENDPEKVDQALSALVTQGVRVTEWRSLGEELEQIFLQLGAKELA